MYPQTTTGEKWVSVRHTHRRTTVNHPADQLPGGREFLTDSGAAMSVSSILKRLSAVAI
jgi:hypothetical protein